MPCMFQVTQCDIFSVHQAVQNGSSVLFEDDRTVLKTKDGTVFDMNKVWKLYYLPTVQSSDHMCAFKEKSVTLKQFHQMMGHCNRDDFIKLQNICEGIKIKGPKDRFFCDVCTKASNLMQPSILSLTIMPKPHHKWFIQIWQVQLPQLPRAVSGMPYVLWMIILDLCPAISYKKK